jgi:hypothetical protein
MSVCSVELSVAGVTKKGLPWQTLYLNAIF